MRRLLALLLTLQPSMAMAQSTLPHDQFVSLLRQHVKYVFVLFQENRSFDSYFGTFPGADGLFSKPAAQTPGFTQPIMNVDGTMGSISPFRIDPSLWSSDLDDVDHGHVRMAAKMDVIDGNALMDRFALLEEKKYLPKGQTLPTLKARQYAELDMGYEDCNTIPFLWNYANRFVLFDHFFQHTIGPSTPNAIAMIAGQTGETQWVKHPDESTSNPKLAATGEGEPLVFDNDPALGVRNPADKPKFALNQTYASLPLTLLGRDATVTTGQDTAPGTDLADVRQDIPAIAGHGSLDIPWGWYEEGYDREPTDTTGPASHDSYIGHHNGPQYFGYVVNNPAVVSHLHGLQDFFDDIGARRLSSSGGVYYVRGGFEDIAGLKPADPDPAVQHNFMGDDDHPGYSDSALSEALVARTVNAIARSPYWPESVIIITYDESEGDYDHVPPKFVEYDPAGLPLSPGPRIPLIVISPYGRTHVVDHDAGDHNSVIKLIDTIYGLPRLADLPDEAQARVAGLAMFKQAYLGPADDKTPGIGDLLSAFDPARLTGQVAAVGAARAIIPDRVVNTIPAYGNRGCEAIGVVPTDFGKPNPLPADFNPRPSTNPSK